MSKQFYIGSFYLLNASCIICVYFIQFSFRRLRMGKRSDDLSDLSPRKKGQIRVLLEETSLTQKDIAKKMMVSPQIVNVIAKSLKSGL